MGENSKTLKLIGSQISLSPRSNKQNLLECHKKYRPCSAIPYCQTVNEHFVKYRRPKSAECTTLNPSHKCLQVPVSPIETDLSGDHSLRVSHFTDLSSKLLQNLLGNSTSKMEIYTESQNKNRLFNSNTTLNKKSVEEDSCSHVIDEDLKNYKALSELPEIVEEKTVQFTEFHHLDFNLDKTLNYEKSCADYSNKKNHHSCLKNYLEPFIQETPTCQWWQRTCENANFVELEIQSADSEVKSGNDTKSLCSVSEAESKKSREKNLETFHSDGENLSNKIDNNNFKKTINCTNENLKSPSSPSNLQVENVHTEKNSCEASKTSIQSFKKNTHKEEILNVDKEDLKQKVDLTDSTYEEIINLLEALDEEDTESLNLEDKELKSKTILDLKDSSEKSDYLNAVSSYLEEIELEDDKFSTNYHAKENWSSENIISPRLEDLLNKNSVELAHEVFSLKIQIEDQKKGIKLLRDTLAEMKEAKKYEEVEHQEALHKVTSEAEALVQRHQKFIKQLLNEKKNLNETVSKLVQDLNSGEEKYKKNIKAIEEKHLVEIKRAKEAQAVADKIKREKWMENKTKKIKEMTVKGLEPELSRMAARQQEEMTELRNLHKAELEAVELRAARRNSELINELRAELTREKERAITKETTALRTALEKEFEEDKIKLQQYCQTLKERIRKQEERISNQELEFQQRLIDYKQEEERNKQKIMRNHQENIEEIRRQHLIELRTLKESEEADKQVLLNNYKKEQAAKFLEKEAELHQQYKKERDKEIEMAIEALEKESAQIQSELNTANEGRLKRLKDKMEGEIRELEISEASLRVKLSETKSILAEKEDIIMELNSEMRQLQTELTFFKKSCEEMSLEKSKLKEVIRGEFENSISSLIKEKENLEKEITTLKELHIKELAKKDQMKLQVKYEMQKELTRLYSRIKTAVSKKEKIIESLREENGTVTQKCRQLEFLLDQQRRNLLLQ